MARRKLARIALAVALVALATDQAIQHTALRDGYFLGHRIAPFDPPIFCADQQASLERIRVHVAAGGVPLAAFDFDPLLGWAPRREEGGSGTGEMRWDWAGSRIGAEPLARPKLPGTVRAVAVGDSFTLGMEVAASEAWPALVDAQVERLEVANLGMAGYGIDQALLRLERDGFPLQPDLVWFGILPSAALRVVTQYPPAMRHWSPSIAFKPRFEIDGNGELRLVDNPAPTLGRLIELVSSQPEFLAAVGERDLWVRSAPAAYAPFGSSLLHRFAATRAWLTRAEREGRAAKPWLVDHESEIFRLFRAILARAVKGCAQHKVRFRVVVLPEPRDLRDFAANGRAYWADVLEDLEVVDPSRALLDAGGAENPALWSPGGHYSALGNRIVADAVASAR